MERTYRYLLNSVKDKKIERELAIELIQMLEAEAAETVDIAIVGMAAKLPAISDLQEYWEVIENGIDCITEFPDSRSRDITRHLRFKGVPEEEIRYNRSAYLTEIDKFDYKFFKLSPREAALMDPSQRLFLETCWEAIENAGYGGSRLEGSSTGIYAGFASNLRDLYAKMIEEADPSGLSIAMVGNLTAVIPGRVSYLLDLRGPSMVIDTACSSSLVAIDMACQALRSGVCSMALAGGININTMPLDKAYLQTGIESTDGVSRAFDDQSDGSGIGEGIGVVVLKPLKDAQRDNDHIYAVIKGSATNQDGRSAGITAPNPHAQSAVILKAWENAGIDPETIAYMETHGTGTNLGDPIEIQGIQAAFRKHTDKKQFCAVSSLKTNIGHLSEAAGITSVIKAALALQHKRIPPSIHFGKPNRSIPFEESPIYVNTKPRDWEADGHPRRCGVSAFGISGTNCHIVLEEAPEPAPIMLVPSDGSLLTLSAKTKQALETLIGQYAAALQANPGQRLDDICYTASTGRGHYSHRLAVRCASTHELLRKLEGLRLDGWDASDPDIVYGYHRLVEKAKEQGDLLQEDADRLSEEAHRLALSDPAGPEAQTARLRQLAKAYAAGAAIDWEILYRGITARKVPLPAYPFEKSRCWITLPEQQAAEEEGQGHLFYGMSWKAEPLEESGERVEIGEVLLLRPTEGSPFIQDFADRLNARGIPVIEATIGEAYERIDPYRYSIANREEDYDRLLADTSANRITHIVHLCGLPNRQAADTLEELERLQDLGVFNLVRLARAVMRTARKNKLHMLLFSSFLHAITREEPSIQPETAPFIGLGKVITQEFPALVCKAVDIDDATSADAVLPELEWFSNQYQAGYRADTRFVETFGRIEPLENPPANLSFRKDGVYLITGGTGGIGLETAQYIASKAQAKIALVNRTRFPDRERWPEIVSSGTDPSASEKIRRLQQIESDGAEVILLHADVSDYAAMSELIAQLRATYGRINGVIHGAGIAGAGYLFKKDIPAFDAVMRPKVLGTWILDRLTREDELDFFIMQSSGVSLVGEAGQGDYVAGNSYLDAFAAYRRQHLRHALTVNWVSWKEAGMSVRFGINVDSFYKAIPTAQAIHGLDLALNRNLSRVLIGEMNESPEYLSLFTALPFKLTDQLKDHYLRLLSGQAGQSSVVSNGMYDTAMLNDGKLIVLPKGKNAVQRADAAQQVLLVGKDGEGYSDVEQQIAGMFSSILGYQEIHVEDSLFELGGDSLLLMRIHQLVDAKYPGLVSITDMFEYPSVRRLAQHIAKQARGPEALEKVPNKDVRQEARELFEQMAQGTLSLDDALYAIDEL